jgi:predicted dehydrogenase
MSAQEAAAVPVGLRVLVTGTGEPARGWEEAMRGAGAEHVRRGAWASADIGETAEDEDYDVIVFAGSQRDLGAAIRRAILSHKHLLCTRPLADSRQLMQLEELARARNLVFLFDAAGLGDPRTRFVRRATQADHPLRRILYATASVTARDGIESGDRAIHAIARALSFHEGLPARVSCHAVQDAMREGAPIFMSAVACFENGSVLRLDVSRIDVERHDLLVLGTEARTIVLDGESTLRVQSMMRATEREAGGGVREERMPEPESSHQQRVAELFTAACREGRFQSNAREMAAASLVWEAAQASMLADGAMTPLPSIHPLVAKARPSLHVIEGGGHAVEAAAPRLRVVAGGRRGEFVAPTEPPRSA